MTELRLMTEADVPAALELTVETFEELARRRNEPPEAPPDPTLASIRFRDLVRRDPGGSWVAEAEGDVVACALALRREDVWGLSLLVVKPGLQSAGIGRAILERAHSYADGARGRIILSSQDPRAIRAYSRLGLALHPAVFGLGTPRAIAAPVELIAGGAADIPFTEAVDRHVRGAAHGPDIATLLEMGQTLLIAPERGYAVVSESGGLRLMAAFDEDGASDILRAVLARAGDRELMVEWLTAEQQWAIRVCIEAGLEIKTDAGNVFLAGDVGPFRPYIPSGAFL